jgi:hypothetical protein
MKKTTVSISLLILLLGLGITMLAVIPASATANDLRDADDQQELAGDDDDGDDDATSTATQQDEDTVNSATASMATAMRGTILIGPSTSGEALRILRTGYTLEPLSGCSPLDPRCNANPIVVGSSDLDTPWIVDRLKASYEAGHGVTLTDATAADIERLRNLLGHHGSLQHNGNGQVDLVAFRKAQRTDGQFHFSSHVLLPRTADETGLLTRQDKKGLKRVSGAVRRKLKKKLIKLARLHLQQAQAIADRNDIEALGRVFSATAVVPEPPPQLQSGNQQQNLLEIAESYETHAVQSDSFGDQAQVVNTVWSVRSFLNSADFYYVLQEADYVVVPGVSGDGRLKSWNNSVDSGPGAVGTITLLQPSPQSTMETTTVTSAVSKTVGVSAGWNETQGLDASVSASTTITNSKTTNIPPITITNSADFQQANLAWTYHVNDLPQNPDSITLFNQWIWQVPFSSYTLSGDPTFVFGSTSILDADYSRRGKKHVLVEVNPVIPWPFGKTFALQQPVVTGVNPSCVNSGDQFTIQGTGMYPSMVTAVLIGGTPFDAANIRTVSDTQINVIAPDTVECHGTGCAVAVQTAEGTSNTNFNIIISDFCD